MRDASEMQVRRYAPWASRAAAVVTALCILLAGVCALRHETSVAHVRDGLTGELQHAHALAEAHAYDTTPHLHGRDVDAHAEVGTCALLAALDHATILPTSVIEVFLASPPGVAALAEIPAAPPAFARYRLAPKTSPPTHG